MPTSGGHAVLGKKSRYIAVNSSYWDSLFYSFDVDLPVEVDDAYWETEDPNMAFRQPPDVPCTVTAFNLFIKLSQIVAFTTRTIVRIFIVPQIVVERTSYSTPRIRLMLLWGVLSEDQSKSFHS